MSELPERIWASKGSLPKVYMQPSGNLPLLRGYVRDDLCDPLRDERVRALVEALEAVVFAAEAHEETGDMMQEHWLDDALAALRAIKEPKPR